MTKDRRRVDFGISLRTVIIAMFVVGIIVSILLFLSMNQTTESYKDMESATTDYVECQNSVYVIWDAISELSERSRNFVVTGSPEEVILYFNDVQVERSRDTARDAILDHLVDNQTIKHLNTAIQLSDRMMKVQYYAMRLAVEAYGYDISKYPIPLQEVELEDEDLNLSQEEQKIKASNLLFDKDYSLLKSQVDIRVGLCKNALIAAMDGKHQQSSGRLQQLLLNQQRLIFAMVAVLLLVLVFVLAMVVYPLNKLISGISSGYRLNVRGASEIKFLSTTYNRMHDEMEEANTKLGYEASHDPLTGLFNRSTYDEIRLTTKGKKIALILIDVDFFKEVNDTHGHDVGDKVLTRVANVLMNSFRGEDKVCRIGGDEFAVIMMNTDSSVSDIIRRKIQHVAETLRQAEGIIPPVTLSVGVAFSDRMNETETIYKNADKALYQIKENGRNGCGFYNC